MKGFAVVIVVLAVLAVSVAASPACTNSLQIVDDDALSARIELARKVFLATRPKPFTRLNAAILIEQPDKSWKRGSYNMWETSYPASCIKLTYLVSAIRWCEQHGHTASCIDTHVRPMIQVSDNFETGIVVDYITGAPNVPMSQVGPAFYDWVAKRNYTQNWFAERGLLGNQVLLHKTFPTNSGSTPNGAELLARSTYGMNAMNAACAASLMAEIVAGSINPTSRDYMLHLLQHQRWSYSSFGPGLPPGSVIYTKTGNAYDTVEEIAYVVLPNGKSFVISTLTNGYEPDQEPYFDTLGYFIHLVIEYTGIGAGLPPAYIFDESSGQGHVQVRGDTWTKAAAPDMHGKYYWLGTGANPTATYNFTVPQSGIYEVSVWAPQAPTRDKNVLHTVAHANGVDTIGVDQTKHGGRWFKLADFNFDANQQYSVLISRPGNQTTNFAVNALKLSLFPSCNGIPGTACAPL